MSEYNISKLVFYISHLELLLLLDLLFFWIFH